MRRPKLKVRGLLVLGLAGMTGLSLVACEPLQTVSFEVNSTRDAVDAIPGDGVCETATPGECTLRAAVQEANALPSGHQAVIGLQPEATYAIKLVGCPDDPMNEYWRYPFCTSDDVAAVGDFDIIGNVSIVGRGATIDGEGGARLFDVRPGARLRADHLTLRGGSTSFDDPIDGPIIYLDWTETLDDPDALDGAGGAIYNQGTLVLEQSSIIHSHSAEGGGALHQVSGSSTLRDVHISSSVAAMMWGLPYYEARDGSVIEIAGGDLSVHRSTLTANGPSYPSRNAVTVISQGPGTTVSIVDSTMPDGAEWFRSCPPGEEPPPGEDDCGYTDTIDAVHNHGGTTTVLRSTFLGNRNDLVGTGTFQVGGSVFEHCEAVATSFGFNVDGDGSCHRSAQPTDVVAPSLPGEFGPSLAGLFGPLGAHGGATETLVPLAGVAEVVDAIPAGTPLLCDGLLPLDQRGQPRPRGLGCDVGAVERQPSDS